MKHLIISGKNTNIILTYDNSSTNAQTAVSIINSYIDQYSKSIVTQRLISKGIDPEMLSPIKIQENTLEKKEQGQGKISKHHFLFLYFLCYIVL